MKKMNVENNRLSAEIIIEMSGKLNSIYNAINERDDNGVDNGYFYPLMDVANCINDIYESLYCVVSIIDDEDKDNTESSINCAGVIYIEPDVDEYGDI